MLNLYCHEIQIHVQKSDWLWWYYLWYSRGTVKSNNVTCKKFPYYFTFYIFLFRKDKNFLTIILVPGWNINCRFMRCFTIIVEFENTSDFDKFTRSEFKKIIIVINRKEFKFCFIFILFNKFFLNCLIS